MSRLSDQCFTMPEAPVWGFDDPFYDSAGMTSREPERCLSSERSTSTRIGHAAGSRSSICSGTPMAGRAAPRTLRESRTPSAPGEKGDRHVDRS